MSRVIKFRAFINDEMINADELAFEDYGLLQDQLGSEPCLMQFTGLLDMNGKEVYEGDVISGFICDGKFDAGLVIFDAGTFSVKFSEMYTPCLYEVYESEIQGNIYESPDLLTHEE